MIKTLTVGTSTTAVDVTGGVHVIITNRSDDATVYASLTPEFTPDGDGVKAIGTGSADIFQNVSVYAIQEGVTDWFGTVYLSADGDAKVQIETTNNANFSRKEKGGGDSSGSGELVPIIEDNVATGLNIDGVDWNIVLPNTVTTIQTGAFTNWGILQSIYVSSSATVEDSSIADSTALITYSLDDDSATIVKSTTNVTSLNIVNTIDGLPVTHIGDNAFQTCTNLTSIEIPNSVTSIGAFAFYKCTSLTNIDIPSSVTSIETYAFRACKNLTSIVIPDSVTSIGTYAFADCSILTSIEIPDSVTSIENYSFYDCKKLTNITIPSSVTSIGDNAFEDCTSLTSIEIPNGVNSIGTCAFQRCTSLTNIEIPDSVTYIGISAFYGCTSLKNIYYRGTAEQWSKISIGSSNTYLTNATKIYNYTGDGSEL